MENKLIAKSSIEINATVEKVWEALTTPELIKKYFFGTDAKSDWKVGSPITFSGTWEGKAYEDKGDIIQSEKNKLFKYTYWSSMAGKEDKPENYANVTYELSSKGNHTVLTISQDNVPTQEGKEHSEKNWSMVLTNLKQLLES